MPGLLTGLVWGWVYVWYAVAIAFLTSLLSGRALARRFGDYAGYVLYFVAFFALMFFVPAVGGFVFQGGFGTLAAWGLTPGRAGLGAILLAAYVPFCVAVLAIAARDPEMAVMYPFARSALQSRSRFIRYEVAYLVLYYLAWEFCFRGVLFLPLARATGLVPAIGIQMALTAALHIGHPRSEIWGTLLGGLAFGLIAYITGSVLYTTLMHAALGIGVDCIQWRRRRSATAA
jgi:membrane protease YdiL (CAAX protease family)